MVSIEVHGGQPPRDALRDAVDWGRVVVATLARGVVATVLGLALWAAAPAVIGWQPTTVVTGSMEPRLLPGDVVVSRPASADAVRMGKILLADDPDRAGHLRMHRYVAHGPGGTLVTKGDANPQPDSTPLEPSAVHGVAFLRVPVVGTPILWLRNGEWPRVGVLALALVGLLALCTVDGSLRRLVAADDRDDREDPDRGAGTGADAGLEALAGAAPSLPSDTTTLHGRRAARRQERSAVRRRRLGGVAAVLVLAGGAGVLLPARAGAVPWPASTGNPVSSFSALTVPEATTLTCSANADGSVNIAFGYTGPAATSFSVVTGSTVLATGSTSPVRVVSSGLLGLGQQYTVAVQVNSVGNWVSTSTATTRIRAALVTATLSCA